MQVVIEHLVAFLQNRIFLSCFFAWFVAQAIKLLTKLVREKKFDYRMMFALGGMPSSHSATVAALLMATLFDQGITPLVIVVFFLALIIIRDSMGVRQEVGKHARLLNRHAKLLSKFSKTEKEIEKLEELVGHTFTEVIVGCVLGVAVAIAVFLI